MSFHSPDQHHLQHGGAFGVPQYQQHLPYGDLRSVWQYHQPQPPAPHVQPMAPNDQNTWGVLAHVSALILGWVGPLIVLLVFGERSEWVRANAKEALNFAITLTIGVVASYVLTLILIGLPLLIACVVLAYVLPILAAVKANRGEFHRYPLTIRFLGRGQ